MVKNKAHSSHPYKYLNHAWNLYPGRCYTVIMKKDLDKNQLFHNAVSTILWEKWDPIGVNDGETGLSDEYDSYVPLLVQIAITEATTMPIQEALGIIVTRSMGLARRAEHDLEIAELILQRKEQLFDTPD